MKLAQAKALALKLLYVGENGYALVSIGLLLMKLGKYVYERYIIMGDFNIDVTNKEVEFDKLGEFCDLFNLTNLITSDCMFLPCHVRVSEWIHTP